MIFIYTVWSCYLLATRQHSEEELVRRKIRLGLSNLFRCGSVRFVQKKKQERLHLRTASWMHLESLGCSTDSSSAHALLCSCSINMVETHYTSWHAAHARHAGFWLLSSGKLKRMAVIPRYPATMVSLGSPKAWKSRRNAPHLPSIFYQVLVSPYPKCNQINITREMHRGCQDQGQRFTKGLICAKSSSPD